MTFSQVAKKSGKEVRFIFCNKTSDLREPFIAIHCDVGFITRRLGEQIGHSNRIGAL